MNNEEERRESDPDDDGEGFDRTVICNLAMNEVVSGKEERVNSLSSSTASTGSVVWTTIVWQNAGNGDHQWQIPVFTSLFSPVLLLIASQVWQTFPLQLQYLQMEKLVK